MDLDILILRLSKHYPLTISRGTSSGSMNLYAVVRKDGIVGIGECAPPTADVDTLAVAAEPWLRGLHATGVLDEGPEAAWTKAREMGIHPAAIAAVDIALWDWRAKRAGLPLYRLLGLGKPIQPTTVTIGINPPETVKELVPEMLERWQAKKLKVKLGSPAGLDHDQESYLAAREAALAKGVTVRVDANGGWSLAGAKEMMAWLASRDCEYVEQPLPKGAEDQLPELFARRPLPLFLDESVQVSDDVAPVADRCDGINLKLMKTGGITDALRVVEKARGHGLSTMIGCMSDSTVGIAAGAAMGALFDHIDLDSHLNLDPDPAEGLDFVDGVVMPSDLPGHGARLRDKEAAI